VSGGALAASGVSYRYPGAPAEVIDEFSHVFPRGGLAAIVAPSGSGKSTLLSLLGLLLRPAAGSIIIDGVPVDWRRRGQLAGLRAGRFGWVFQNNACLEARTALDNVAVALLASGAPMGAARAAAADALGAVGLADRAMMDAKHLSGGEQQRMAIARALVGDRPFVLADEPTGNLDHANSRMVIDALRACADRGAAVVIATHDLDAAAAADDVVDLAKNSRGA
jgi:ABC-type lipoprotein export system ATPase subunit